MSKMTDIKLEKISDIDKYLFIEKGLRRGISYIAKRYAKANKKYMNNYDPKKQSIFISYLDIIIYMVGQWVNIFLMKGLKGLKNVDRFDVMSINEKSIIGYLLEVDLEYPDKLHELHNDDPLAPKKLALSSDMLLKYCKTMSDKYEIKVGDMKKIISNLGNETNYVVH